MPRLKLPQNIKDQVEADKKKKPAAVDPKQTSIFSFFDKKEDSNKDNEKSTSTNTTTTTTTTTTTSTSEPSKITSPKTRRSSVENTEQQQKEVVPIKKPTATSRGKSAAKPTTKTTKKQPASREKKKKDESSEDETESEKEQHNDNQDNQDEEEEEEEEEVKSIVNKSRRPSTKKLPPSKKSSPIKKSSVKKSIDNEDEVMESLDENEKEIKNKKNNNNDNDEKVISPQLRSRNKPVSLSFLDSSDEDSEKEEKKSTTSKSIGKKRKKDDSDFEPTSESESDDDDDYVSNSGSETESEQEDIESFKFVSKKKLNNKKKSSNSNNGNDEEDGDDELFKDIEMKDNKEEEEVIGEPVIIGSGRVVLPAGTPDFKPDKNAGKKLLKAHLEVQEKEEKNRQQQQQQQQQNQQQQGDSETEEPEKPTKATSKGKGSGKNSKGPQYTPLEQQFLAIKKDNPDTVLMVECGYKYKFFGDDAEVANRVLNIYSYVAKNFLNASIPCQRLYFHLRRLVLAGYKVGVVEQTETAALKAISSSKSQPFERKLTRIYTSSTFIDDEVDDSLQNSSPQYLVSFYESSTSALGTNSSDDVIPSVETISFVAVSIRTGEIIYDTFKDNLMRSQLETALTHLKPSEILMPPSTIKKEKSSSSSSLSNSGYKFSNLTYKCLKSYSKLNSARTQNMDSQIFNYDAALIKLEEFYESNNCIQVLDHIKSIMNNDQIICLGVLLSYLDQFIHFSSILKVSSNFKAFKTSNHLVLPHSSIVNLEILANESDNSEKGSLIWLMNRTSTFSGRRMFTNWLCKPLNQYQLIKERQDAVEELVQGIKVNSKQVESITNLFKSHIPDLQRNLSRIYYKNQCTPKEFLNTMSSLKRILELFKEINKGYKFNSNLLNQIFKIKSTNQIGNQIDDISGIDNDNNINQDSDKLTERINYFLSNLNHDAAKEYATVNCEKSNLWLDYEKYSNLLEIKKKIKNIEEEFKKILKDIKYNLKKPSLEFIHMPKLNLEYLVELPLKFAGIPKTWIKVSSTQKVVRYHTPEILEQLKLLSQCREMLKIQSQESWLSFLSEFTLDYGLFSNFVHKISNLDCLFSLAKISCMDGYVKPEFSENEMGIEIIEGRHPVVEVLLNGTYVPNSVRLSSSKERSMIITGPNMGGKSSFIRQSSLIVIMAQMGCYVPAKQCKLGVFDAIYTRMGAHDNIEKGSSTFFIELQETSEILKYATPKSLVILDELGRGTSTHDGVALAYSTLKYIIDEKKCFCLFVTHYPLLAQLELMYPNIIGNYHMGFIEKKDTSDDEHVIPKVIFLYQLVKGAAQNSYGLNVANMAGLPNEILKIASIKSNEMKESITKRANLINSNDNQNEKEIENEIKKIIKTWNQNSTLLSKDQLIELTNKLKSLQLKL